MGKSLPRARIWQQAVIVSTRSTSLTTMLHTPTHPATLTDSKVCLVHGTECGVSLVRIRATNLIPCCPEIHRRDSQSKRRGLYLDSMGPTDLPCHPMLPLPIQFLVAMIAHAINERF